MCNGIVFFIRLGLLNCKDAYVKSNSQIQFAPVVFEQKIELNKNYEHKFDFYVSRWGRKNLVLGIEFRVPDYKSIPYEQISDYFYDWDAGVEEKIPYFDISLDHYLENGKIVHIPLEGYVSSNDEDLNNIYKKIIKQPARFCIMTMNRKVREGKEYEARRYSIAEFNLDGVADSQKGFYRLKVKAVKNMKLDYGIEAKIMIDYPLYHK